MSPDEGFAFTLADGDGVEIPYEAPWIQPDKARPLAQRYLAMLGPESVALVLRTLEALFGRGDPALAIADGLERIGRDVVRAVSSPESTPLVREMLAGVKRGTVMVGITGGYNAAYRGRPWEPDLAAFYIAWHNGFFSLPTSILASGGQEIRGKLDALRAAGEAKLSETIEAMTAALLDVKTAEPPPAE